jgi:hypothetical protein
MADWSPACAEAAVPPDSRRAWIRAGKVAFTSELYESTSATTAGRSAGWRARLQPQVGVRELDGGDAVGEHPALGLELHSNP